LVGGGFQGTCGDAENKTRNIATGLVDDAGMVDPRARLLNTKVLVTLNDQDDGLESPGPRRRNARDSKRQ
jgi:hypothetical protein